MLGAATVVSGAVGLALGTGHLVIALALVALLAFTLVVGAWGSLLGALGLGMYVASPTFGWPAAPMKVLWAGVLLMIVLAIANRDRLDLRLATPWYALFALPPVLAATVHLTGPSAIRGSEYPLIALAGTIWLIVTFAQSRPAVFRRVVAVFIWVTSAMAFMAVYQRAVGYWPVIDDLTNGFSAGSASYPDRSGAIFGHPLVYAGVAQIAAYAALLLRPRWWQIAFVLNAGGVVLTGSRSAWIGAAIMFALVVGLQLTGRIQGAAKLWQMLLALAACIAIGAAIAPAATDSVSSGVAQRLSGSDASVGIDARADRVRQGLDATLHPNGPLGHRDLSVTLLGHGPDAAAKFWAAAPKLQASQGAATFDNTYVTWLYDFGFVGLGVFVLAFVVLLWRSSWTGRILLAGLIWDIWAYVAPNWPVTLLLFGLAAGIGQLPELAGADAEEPEAA